MKLIEKLFSKRQKVRPQNEPLPSNIDQITLKIKGIHCKACASSIEHALNREHGVVRTKVDYASEKAVVVYDTTKTTKEKVRDSFIFREPSMFSAEIAD